MLATAQRDFYEKAVFLGHFNKRCFQEVSPENELYPFSLTGSGMNLRPSPLAIALANQQFSYLDSWLEQKENFANKWIQTFSNVPYLKMPSFASGSRPAWYALVMNFIPELAPCSREEFVNNLQEKYLLGEVDIPMSTCPNHLLPLFVQPEKIRQDLYPVNSGNSDENFPEAKRFFETAIKIFVLVFKKDEVVFDYYIDAFSKVIESCKNS